MAREAQTSGPEAQNEIVAYGMPVFNRQLDTSQNEQNGTKSMQE